MIEQLQKTILGTMMAFPSEIDTAAGLIAPDDFTLPMYSDIFSFLVKEQGADFVLIAKEFANKYPIHEIVSWGDETYLPSFLKKHCQQLREIKRKDTLHRLLIEARMGLEERTSAEIIEHINSTVLLMDTKKTAEPELVKSIVSSSIRIINQRYENKGKITGLPYGWADLDEATNGMHGGDLIIIAGRPSMGKTAMAVNIAESVCEFGKSALIFSLEMSKEQLIERLIASSGRLDFGRIRSGYLQDADFGKLTHGAGKIHGHNLHIDDTAAVTLAEIRYKSRAIKRKSGLDLIVIDYLQLVSMANKESRTLAIGEISRGLKQLARELNIPIILLSQLNRAVDARTEKRPTMSDLRDSGEIEQDADVILFPFRPAAYCDKCRDGINSADHDINLHQSVAEIIVEKQRNGERNIKIPLVWIGKFQRFDNMLKE